MNVSAWFLGGGPTRTAEPKIKYRVNQTFNPRAFRVRSLSLLLQISMFLRHVGHD